MRFETYLRINREYKARYNYSLVHCDNQGHLIYGMPECGDHLTCDGKCADYRRAVLEEALNCGRPMMRACGERLGMWGVPVMFNNLMCGGLVVAGASIDGDESDIPQEQSDALCKGLLSIAARYNVVNLPLLESRANKLMSLDRFKHPLTFAAGETVAQLRSFLMEKELPLLESVRNRNQQAARVYIDEIVQQMLNLAEDHLCLCKGCVLDLLIAMDHAAVESGTDFATAMRCNCSLSLEIYQVETLRELSELLVRGFERIFDIVSPYQKSKNDVLLKNILGYLERNFHENVSREWLATHFNISISHLSRLLSQKTGRTLVEILNQYRSDRAAQLLVDTDLPLVEIALECGFQEQSYFGKVFREHYGVSPSRYRKARLSKTNLNRNLSAYQ